MSLADPDSFDLDGAADIARHLWTVDLGTPEAVSAVGQNVSFDLLLGSNVVTLAVADQRGSFGVDTTTVTVADTTGPALAVNAPAAAIEYPHSALLTLDYGVTDACTGVAQQTARLDGATTVGGHGLASGEVLDLLLELAPGPHVSRSQRPTCSATRPPRPSSSWS